MKYFFSKLPSIKCQISKWLGTRSSFKNQSLNNCAGPAIKYNVGQWQLGKQSISKVLQYLWAIVEAAYLHVPCMPELGTASLASDAFLSEYSLRRSFFSCKILSQTPLESLKGTSCSLYTNHQRAASNHQLLLAVKSNKHLLANFVNRGVVGNLATLRLEAGATYLFWTRCIFLGSWAADIGLLLQLSGHA